MDVEMILSLVPFAVILCAGIFVQAAAGFAAGLVIVPALLWFGYSIPAAQCSLLVATIPQNIWGVWSLRESIEPKQVVWPGIGRVCVGWQNTARQPFPATTGFTGQFDQVLE